MSKKKNNVEQSLIAEELGRFEKQIQEMLSTLESVKLMEIEDVDERLKALKLKQDVTLKMSPLIAALDELRNRNKNIPGAKGSKELSPHESGLLDDDNEEEYSHVDTLE